MPRMVTCYISLSIALTVSATEEARGGLNRGVLNAAESVDLVQTRLVAAEDNGQRNWTSQTVAWAENESHKPQMIVSAQDRAKKRRPTVPKSWEVTWFAGLRKFADELITSDDALFDYGTVTGSRQPEHTSETRVTSSRNNEPDGDDADHDDDDADGDDDEGTWIYNWKGRKGGGNQAQPKGGNVEYHPDHEITSHDAVMYALEQVAIFVGIAFLMLLIIYKQFAYLIKSHLHKAPRMNKDGKRGEEASTDWSASFRGVSVLLKNWLTDDSCKWTARFVVGLVVVYAFVEEAVTAYVTSKLGAEVSSSIAGLHESQDLDRVKKALVNSIRVHLLISLPLSHILGPWVEVWFKISLTSFLTCTTLGKYFNGGGQAFYRIKMSESHNNIDNPDQRIGEDIPIIVNQIYRLYSNTLSAVFGAIMWAQIFFALGGAPLLCLALSLSIVRFVIAYGIFGNSLVRANQFGLWTDADLRYSLMRVREHSETVALSGGGARENQRAEGRFWLHIDSLKEKTFVNMQYGSVMYIVGQIPSLAIWMYNLPRLMSGEMELGTVHRLHQGYSNIVEVMQFFTQNFGAITNLQANAERVLELDVACAAANAVGCKTGPLDTAEVVASSNTLGGDEEVDPLGQINIIAAEEPIAFSFEAVVVSAPGTPLRVGGASVVCNIGEGLLVSGASGLGKSSVLKSLAGLWLHGDGTIRRNPKAEVVVLSHACYVPQGTLADVIIYPEVLPEDEQELAELEAKIRAVFQRASIEVVLERWGLHGESRDFSIILSPGEKQRIGFARLFLKLARMTPDSPPLIGILDESTGAVDVSMEEKLYKELHDEMAGGKLLAMASVGHRPTLPAFHDTELQLGEQTASQKASSYEILRDGAWCTPEGESVPWRHVKLPPRSA